MPRRPRRPGSSTTSVASASMSSPSYAASTATSRRSGRSGSRPVRSGRTTSGCGWCSTATTPSPTGTDATSGSPTTSARLVERWLKVIEPDRYTVVISDEADHAVLPRTFEAMLGLPEGFVVPDPSRSNRGLSWAETELIRSVNQLLEDRGVPRPRRRRLLQSAVLREMQTRPTPAGLVATPPGLGGPAPRPERPAIQDLGSLSERGVRLVGDPGLMRMPGTPRRLPLPPGAGDRAADGGGDPRLGAGRVPDRSVGRARRRG